MANTKHNGTSHRLYEYYRKSPGIPIHYRDAAETLGIQPNRANAALGHLERKPDMPIVRTGQRGFYAFAPTGQYVGPEIRPEPESVAPKPAPVPFGTVDIVQSKPETFIPEIYEFVGRSKSGTILVKSEDGQLYKLTEWDG